ncbi:MAG: hypothetical protein KDA65_08005 [Planctomycetaceae bacterium]|nr:hypothetical protein [Planctomycetaceae bacterium]
MPEHEFELYLSLLSKFLKLNPQQREEIAEELRGHLEMRLEDLAKEGHSREEAIRLALDEMGDAGELAQHFSTIAKSRRRKLIMRCTLGTAVAFAFGLVLFTAFWNEPGRPHEVLHSMAQEGAAGVSETLPQVQNERVAKLAEKTKVFKSEELKKWDAILDEKFELDLLGLSLQEVLNQMATLGEFQIVIHNSVDEMLGDLEGYELHESLSGLSLRQSLRIILWKQQLTYAPRDGVLYILTMEEALRNRDFYEIQMYDCRDFIVASQNANDEPLERNRIRGEAEQLSEVIQMLVGSQDRWEIAGGQGTIQAMGGILIVKQTSDYHHEVEEFLDQLRQPYLAAQAKLAAE